MPLDPQIEALLNHPAVGVDPSDELTLTEVRAGFEDLSIEWQADAEEVAEISDERAEGERREVPLRVYRPAAREPSCLLVLLHGGAWQLGSIDLVDGPCRALANAGGCIVVAVEYRLAPENPYPAPLDDTMAALRWASSNAERLGTTPDRVVVAGESAGGNLAAAAPLRARDEGGPPLAAQILIYPATDHDLDRPSYRENDGLLLTRQRLHRAWLDYVPDASERDHPYVSPLRAPDLGGLPAATVLTCGYDPLRDEGELYAKRLAEAGVPVTAKRYDGLTHGAMHMTGIVERARQVVDDVAAACRAVGSG